MKSAEPLYRKGQAQIKSYIADHGLTPGSSLPTEAEMAALFGMSRLSLREAVKGLETVGILTSKQGDGVRVAEFSFAPIVESLPYLFQTSGRSFRDLLELRESLEEGLCGRLVGVIRPRDLDTLDAVARAMGDPEQDDGTIAELDRRFHSRMYAPLENTLVTQLIELFWQAFNRMQSVYAIPRPTSEELVSIHVAIVDALRSGDELAVVRAVRAHFANIRDWVDVHLTAEPGGEPHFPLTGENWPA
jgi:DNA-binding FadR family transcriptional regulator